MNDDWLAQALLSAMGIEELPVDMVHPSHSAELLQLVTREPSQILRFSILLVAAYLDADGFNKSALLLRLAEKASLGVCVPPIAELLGGGKG